MKEWPIKRLYKDSVAFKWGVRFFIMALIITLLIFAYQELNKKSTYDNTNATFESSVFQGDFRGADISITKNENKQIPYTHMFSILRNEYGQENWEEMYNTKFILPNNNFAFLSKIKAGEKYILAYSNEDCSDIAVSEAYQISDNFDDEIVCFVKRLACGNGIGHIISNLTTEQLKDEKILQYLYYLPTEKAENNLNSCIIFKEE